jgi:hypothetical protein
MHRISLRCKLLYFSEKDGYPDSFIHAVNAEYVVQVDEALVQLDLDTQAFFRTVFPDMVPYHMGILHSIQFILLGLCSH